MGKSDEALTVHQTGPPITPAIAPPTRPIPKPPASPATGAEETFAAVLAGILHIEHVPFDSHFFDDLGADSMVMAQFCARVRKNPDLPRLSMKDVYASPTISALAASLSPAPAAATLQAAQTAPAAPAAPATPDEPTNPLQAPPAVTEEPSSRHAPARPVGTPMYVLCGAVQVLTFLAYSYVVALVGSEGYEWVLQASGPVQLYLRSAALGTGILLLTGTLPIAAKWLLVGRWKAQEFRIWSWAYIRFWIVKTLVRSNPLALLFSGTPLYSLYLRALGARIGRGATVLARQAPVCTDLFTVGAGSIIRKEALILCYRAHDGLIQTGPVTIGRDAYVGEKTVLDIDTSVGDGAQLGHASALHRGDAIPDGEHWHGSPAERTDLDYARVAPARCGRWRRLGFSLVSLLQVVLLGLPLLQSAVLVLVRKVPAVTTLLEPGHSLAALPTLTYAAAVSAATLIGGSLLGLVFVATIPRLLGLLLRTDRVYPLYGFHYGVHRTITRMTNLKFFTHLFGDSSYIVHYLRYLGYKLSTVEQTGSNFGTQVAHDNPYLSSVGNGTMVADGLTFLNADYSSTSFRVSPVRIGARNFLGNTIAYPAEGRTGDDCLLATKVMVPLDGEIRQGVGLLGSPCFEIPRSVARDTERQLTGEELRTGLAAKNRYNLRTMGVFLVLRWIHLFLLAMIAVATVDVYRVHAHLAAGGFLALSVLASAMYLVVIERAIAGFRRLRPQSVSIYEPYFWWHERFWKVTGMMFVRIFDGTPFKPLYLRLLGVRIGRRVFDDGCGLTERTLATIGDGCTLNSGSTIQCHSQEDGAFKSDRTTIGAGCTLGVGSFVHYGVTMGEGSVLAPDAFLMKGEEVPPLAFWGGNPARELSK